MTTVARRRYSTAHSSVPGCSAPFGTDIPWPSLPPMMITTASGLSRSIFIAYSDQSKNCGTTSPVEGCAS